MKYKHLKWQGEPIDVQFGWLCVAKNKDKPMYWYNFECEETGFAVFFAIRIKQHGQVWYISNEYGEGLRKLKAGGWPNLGHRSLPNDGAFERMRNPEDIAITLEHEFDEVAYAEHESKREKWMKDKFGGTEAYNKIIAIRKMLGSNRNFFGK